MLHDELKPKDRVVLRMTRDGAVEENLTEGTSEKVSKRLEDAQLVAPHDAETGDLAEEVRKRRQLRPDELEDAEGQAQAETSSTDTVQEYKPGEMPISDTPSPHAPHSEAYHSHSVDYGKAFADTAITGKVSRPRAERQIDGEAVLERAAETSAEMPDFGGDAPASSRIERLERKSQKAHERLDAAREKLPTKKVLKKERVFDEETGKGKTRLHFEDLELGVGGNTPVIIKFPFWRMTYQNPKAVYACVNLSESYCPKEIQQRAICIDGDIGKTLNSLQS